MGNSNDLYGANATEWLRRWDAGQVVWSVEMGGLGPGYEQALQICAAETLRVMLEQEWEDFEDWEHKREVIDKAIFGDDGPCKQLGLSGAQVGSAQNLASVIYSRWPECMEDKEVEGRKIQISKNFP